MGSHKYTTLWVLLRPFSSAYSLIYMYIHPYRTHTHKVKDKR